MKIRFGMLSTSFDRSDSRSDSDHGAASGLSAWLRPRARLDADVVRAEAGALEQGDHGGEELRLSLDALHADNVQVPLPGFATGRGELGVALDAGCIT